MVGLYAMRHYVSVHLVMEDFGLASLLWHCWEGLVVDRLPTVDYWIGFEVGCF